jgi:hypothetical protein
MLIGVPFCLPGKPRIMRRIATRRNTLRSEVAASKAHPGQFGKGEEKVPH